MTIRPIPVVAVGVVFTSLSSILVRLSDAPPLVIATYRMAFATALVAPFLLAEAVGSRPVRRTSGGDPEATGKAPGSAILLSVAAGVLLALHFGFWITSLSYTSVAASTVLVTTHPVLVALLARLLGERIGARGAVWMAGALGGGLLLAAGGLAAGGTAPFGNLLAFLGGVTFAGYLVLGRAARRHLGANRYTFVVYAVAAVLLAAATAAWGQPFGPYPAREFALFLALAFFCTLLGHSLFNWSLRYVRPTTVSTGILAEPVIASCLAAALFAEVPSPATVAGGAVIIFCIVLFVRTQG